MPLDNEYMLIRFVCNFRHIAQWVSALRGVPTEQRFLVIGASIERNSLKSSHSGNT